MGRRGVSSRAMIGIMAGWLPLLMMEPMSGGTDIAADGDDPGQRRTLPTLFGFGGVERRPAPEAPESPSLSHDVPGAEAPVPDSPADIID
jgi:hypothetical protein